jgi:hypothetical protein
MADYEQLVQQLAQMFSGGVPRNVVERGTPHPQDTTSPFQMTDEERFGTISPQPEKESFTDMVLGSKYADTPLRTTTAIAEMAGVPEPWARTLGATTDLAGQLAEAGVALGKSKQQAPRGSRTFGEGMRKGTRPSRPLGKKNPLNFDLQASLETLKGTPEGDALARGIQKLLGETDQPMSSLEDILKMYPDIAVEVMQEGADNLPVNASLESGSGGSVEALNRTRDMAAKGQKFVRMGPGGQTVPSTEDGAVGLKPGWSFGVMGPDGFQKLN